MAILTQTDFTDTDLAECDLVVFQPYLDRAELFYTDFCLGAGLTAQKLPIPFASKQLCITYVGCEFFFDRLGLDMREVQDGLMDHNAIKYKSYMDKFNSLYQSAKESLSGGTIDAQKGGVKMIALEFGI